MRITIMDMNTTHKLMNPDVAIKMAKELKKDDPATDYRAVHDPKGTGGSFVGIFEDNEMIMII